MSITREEAIKELERLLSHWDDLENGKRSFRWYSKDAVGLAITALRPVSREQVEKVWRGYWDHKEVISNKSITGKFLLPSCECSLCGCYVQQEVNFCPHCGAPMTDEAVEIRLKELEALKDGSTTD